MTLSPADQAIISQALIAAAREMGAKLIRSAFSTIVREANDASAALLDRNGEVVAQAELNPMQLGSMAATFGPCAAQVPPGELREGDFYINNDPYHGGQHLPDVFIYSPIFFDGELMGFAATVAHHIDIGGGSPGLNMSARELHQEGLILPPNRYNYERDWNGGPLERLIAANIRVPEQTIGDFYAQFAGNSIGIARVQQLCRKYGAQAVGEAMASLIGYSERRMRAAVEGVPDGRYSGRAWLDDDGIGSEPVAVHATVSVEGDGLTVDFAGTADQVATNQNAPFASTMAAVYAAVKGVLTAPDIPFNAGSARPIRIEAPEGCLLNPHRPAPVRARMTAGFRAFNAVVQAFSEAVPERVIAAGFDTTTGPYLSRTGEQGYRIYHEIIGGGYGGSAGADGCSGVDGPMANCSNTPVEMLDMDFDFFRVTAYGLVPDSCGHGRHRGGLGIRRSYAILREGVQFAQYGDRYKLQPPGIFGGLPGAHAACTIERAGEAIAVASKDMGVLRPGDVLTVRTSGGGGYGPPQERAPGRVREDVADGFVTEATAREIYGVATQEGEGPGRPT